MSRATWWFAVLTRRGNDVHWIGTSPPTLPDVEALRGGYHTCEECNGFGTEDDEEMNREIPCGRCGGSGEQIGVDYELWRVGPSHIDLDGLPAWAIKKYKHSLLSEHNAKGNKR